MKPTRGKLLYKFLVVFLGLSAGPLVVGGFQIVRKAQALIQEESVGVKLGIAQKVADNVAAYMENIKNVLLVVHKSSDFLEMDLRRQKGILENVMNAYPMFMRMSVVDPQGRERVTLNRVRSGMDQGLSDQDVNAFRAVLSRGEFIGSVSRSPEGYPQMTIGVPIESIPGRPLGVLLADVNLIDVSSLIRDLRVGQRGYVYVVDGTPQLVAHPDPQTLLSTTVPPEVKAASLAPGERSVGAIEFADQRGRKFLGAFATVPKMSWRVFVQQPLEEAYRAQYTMRSEITKVLVVVLFLTVLLALLMTHRLVKPVRRLQEAMEAVGEGNFDVPALPPTNDEIGALSEKFRWMSKSLKEKTLRLVAAQGELQRWNNELERRVEERTRALRTAQEQLIAQEKLAALGQMASVVGHELRNPLAVMNNSVYYIKTRLAELLTPGAGASVAAATAPEVPAKVAKHLSILETEIDKSNKIIRDILDFARSRPLNTQPLRVDELVSQAIERIQIPTDVQVEKQLGLNGTEALLDEDEVRQVLTNLMENACQAMPSGGTLTVGTKVSEGGGIEIIISDTGCGIPPEHLGKIFAPFFTTKSRGTGLGLAVVKKVMDRHHAQIQVKSEVGQGTAFTLRFPRFEPEKL